MIDADTLNFENFPVRQRARNPRADALHMRQHQPVAGFRLSDPARYRHRLRGLRRDRGRRPRPQASRRELEPTSRQLKSFPELDVMRLLHCIGCALTVTATGFAQYLPG
jgi:hypothetical protein